MARTMLARGPLTSQQRSAAVHPHSGAQTKAPEAAGDVFHFPVMSEPRQGRRTSAGFDVVVVGASATGCSVARLFALAPSPGRADRMAQPARAGPDASPPVEALD